MTRGAGNGRPPGTAEPVSDELVVVGRVGRAHGIRGDVAVEPRTDVPDLRFADGAVLGTVPADRGPLTVESTRWHSGRLLVRFAGVGDRTGAEGLAGTWLVIERSQVGDAGADAWWDHELVGLRAERSSGELLGTVTDVVHAPAQDLLAITSGDGRETLVPFVAAFVPLVDPAGGRLVVDPPDGLLELDQQPGGPT